MDPSLEKRINRQIKAKLHRLTAVVPPGFELTGAEELRSIGIGGAEPIGRGIIGWEGKIESFWKAHALARLPVSIRWQVAEFTASGFGELQKKTERLPWELWLSPGEQVAPAAVSDSSRLWHEGAIVERLRESFLSLGFLPSPEGVAVLFRFENNRCTVSIQGERTPLYRRGFDKWVDTAPLRDNIAWGILLRAGISSVRRLCDPMTGSGSFSLEAALASEGRHPGHLRSFDFLRFPSTRPQAWNHLLSRLPDHHPLAPPEIRIDPSDISPHACTVARHNFAAAEVRHPSEPLCTDFFQLHPDPGGGDSLVVLNPPWGKRLREENTPELIGEIGKKLSLDFLNWRWGVVLPADEQSLTLFRKNLQPAEQLLFRSGGIPLTALFGTIPSR